MSDCGVSRKPWAAWGAKAPLQKPRGYGGTAAVDGAVGGREQWARMTKPEAKPDVDMFNAVRRSRRDLPTVEGTSAYLTVATLLCGFAFAGLILYLGNRHPHAPHVVAASLLAAAFIVLLYAALSMVSLVDTSGSKWRLLVRLIYFIESARSLYLGLALLLASLCVMSFAWSTPLGCVVVLFSTLFIARCARLVKRILRLEQVVVAVDAKVMAVDLVEEALGIGPESRMARIKQLMATLREAVYSPSEETISELRALLEELQERQRERSDQPDNVEGQGPASCDSSTPSPSHPAP